MNPDHVRILAVEDNPGDARLLEETLKDMVGQNHQLVVKGTLHEAFANIDAASIDVILLDLSLPDSQGVETLRRMAAHAPELPIVVMTGHGDDALGLQTIQEGAQDYLVKGEIDAALLQRSLSYAIGRKQAELALHEGEEKFQTLIETATDAIIGMDEQAKVFVWNRAATTIFGYAEDEAMGHDLHGLVVPERYHVKARAGMARFFRDGTGPIIGKSVEMMAQRKDGSEFPVDISISRMRKQSGWQAMAIIRDITMRKQNEEKLHKLSMAVEQAGESVVITNADGYIEYVNPAFTEITGYTVDEVIGKTPAVLKSGKQDANFYREFWNTISGGHVWHGTLIDKRKNGSFYPALLSVSPIINDTGVITHYIGIQQDMTERSMLEEKFQQAQKMEAIGTLVGGLAHDFNNLLAGMMGNLYLAKCKAEALPEVTSRLKKVEELGFRGAALIAQLLTFARKGEVKMVDFPLVSFVKEAYKLAKMSVPENIDLQARFADKDLAVNGDPVQLQQVIMNLLNNARDAVAGAQSPRIMLELSRFEADDAFSSAHTEVSATSFAHIRVSDNGTGISEEYLDKVFEPYFTTKETGKGTGLGLAMAYGAVRMHGGIFSVESEPGQGAAFHVYLPLIERSSTDKPSVAAEEVMPGRGETILLADDEEHVRQSCCDVLKDIGYEVVAAHDGEQAMRIFSAYKKKIDLLILDVVMPKLGGIDVARMIRQIEPRIPIVYVTGYSKGGTTGVKNEPYSNVLIKPFHVEQLSRTVRKLLDSRAPPNA
ncbi:MAG: PAS domain S-box protein [Mariprofundaceae bacterium]